MEKIYRVFAEKRDGFNVEAQNLCRDIVAQLGLYNLKSVRVLARYDVSGISEETFKEACISCFCEPNADIMSHEMPSASHFIIRELQTGTYDQRADSAEQCIKLIAPESSPVVRTASVFIFEGELSEEDMSRLRSYLINPVESREGNVAVPQKLTEATSIPEDVEILSDYNAYTREQMQEFIKTRGLAMSIEDAMFIQEHYKALKRSPTITEIKVIDTYWSDHCRHTTFTTKLTNVSFENDETGEMETVWAEYMKARKEMYAGREKPVTLMDLGTIAAKILKKNGTLDNLDESEEINACSIRCDVDVNGEMIPYLIMFKNETHNHPTEIEPFGGAATCLGGAIRDPLSGRSFVYQAMRVTGAADPLRPFSETLPGKLPQSVITKSAAHGYSSYGNQIGLATGLVDEVYHEGYMAKRMEVGAVIAAAPSENVKRERPLPGDAVLLVGGRTGRDGCGGATGSSKSHTAESLANCGAEVQKGNPITERKIQRLFRRREVASLIKRCNDFGAGGVSVAVGELADGLSIDLDKVPKKYEGLDGTELAISESQERMAVVVAAEDADKFTEFAESENLECTHIATVTDDAHMKMYWRGKCIVDLARAFLDTNGVTASMNAVCAAKRISFEEKAPENAKEELIKRLGDLNECSKRGLVEMFDSTVGANTVLMPFGGKNQSTPTQVMAAKIPTGGITHTGTLMSYGFFPYLSEKSPFHGAMYAVMESLARLVTAGGDAKRARLTFQEYFEKLGKDANKWGKPLSALLGAFYAQCSLSVAAIGGKDSMSGTFNDISVPPTLISFAVVPEDMRKVISPELKKAGSSLYAMIPKCDENGIPDFSSFAKGLSHLHSAIHAGAVLSASTVGMGSIITAIAKAAFGNGLGAKLTLGGEKLFSRYPCTVIFELKENVQLEKYFDSEECVSAGTVKDSGVLEFCGTKVSLCDAYSAYTGTLEKVFTTGSHEKDDVKELSYALRNEKRPSLHMAKPSVVIPVFPGTNCEYESIAAFEREGAKVSSLIIRNTKKGDIEESLLELEKLIRNAQIIMLPGGFSSGDEPDGSAKFSSAVFRNPRIKDAVHELIKNRDGLVLGICNGFQTLIKLGLVPYGEIKDTDVTAPTLTFNRIGRHQSRIVRTRISSCLSPWFSDVNVGDIISVPISHGEGRVIFPSEAELQRVIAGGQIATQYVDVSGKPTMDTDYNPPMSQMAIEALTSPDGRVLGKMGHSERHTDGLYKNVAGDFQSGIFRSGVKYFS